MWEWATGYATEHGGTRGPNILFVPWPKKALGCNEFSRYVLLG